MEVAGDFLNMRKGDEREVRYLGRHIRITQEGYEVEGDIKVVKKLSGELDMEGARGVGTAGVKMEVKADEDAKRLGERDHSQFRRAAAQCNYVWAEWM